MNKDKILIVVDYQKDFVVGSLGFNGAEILAKGIKERVSKYLNEGNLVIFTKDTHDADYLKTLEGKYLPVEHCIRGSKGHELFDDELIALSENESVKLIEKKKFGALELIELKLDVDRIDSIELCGIDTNICVLSNAVICQNFFYKSEILINRQLCGSYNKELEEKTFEVMKNLQMKIVSLI